MKNHRTSLAWPAGRRHALRAALLWTGCTISALGINTTGMAETYASPMHGFDIPAGSLSGALARFGQQAGTPVRYDTKLVSDKTSAGLHGSYDASQALAALLAGTGLQATVQADGSYTLGIASPAADARHAKVLTGVTVTGEATAEGYVADNSDSATKTDTPLIETPQSISVVTRQQIDDQQPQSLNEALRYSPGVVPESEGTASNFWGANSLQLRGFTPGVYLDGLQDDNYGNNMVDPYFYQSVDILSGPASVLYGQASPGGIVNIVSKQPTATPLHEVTLGIGNYDRFQAGFDFSGPLDQDGHWLYRLTGTGLTQDTQTDWIKHRRYGLAPAITWQPDDDTRLTLLGNFTYSPDMGDYSTVPAVGTVLYSPLGKVSSDFSPGDPNFNRAVQRLGMLGWQFEHRFNDRWKFEQSARFTDSRNRANMIWPSGLEADGTTLDRYDFVRDMSARSYLVDNRLETDFDLGPLHNDVLFGLNYTRFNENWRWAMNMDLPPIDIFDPVYGMAIPGVDLSTLTGYDSHAHQTGLYAQDQMSLGHWRFLLGGREDRASVEQTSPQASLSMAKESSHQFTWRAGLVYLFDNGIAPYVSYSTSFQPQFGSTTYTGAIAAPTTGQQYEAGIKYQPPGSANLLTLAAYNLTEQNVAEADPAHPGFVVQVGEIRSRGVEFSDRASLTDNLNLIASYAYTDSRYVRTPTYDTGYNGVLAPVQGNYQYGMPKQTFSLWADYTLHGQVLDGLGFSGGVRYVGYSYGDDVNSFEVPAFTLLDAAVRYDLGAANAAWRGLKLQFNVANLLDKSYVSACTNATGCNFGVRRTLYLSATYDW